MLSRLLQVDDKSTQSYWGAHDKYLLFADLQIVKALAESVFNISQVSWVVNPKIAKNFRRFIGKIPGDEGY
jgi:hypothetical protein